MKKIFLLLTAIVIALPAFSQSSDKRLKGLEKEMEAVLETFKAAGFGVAIVEKDKVLYAKGFGFRDYENKIPADQNTLFAIGSSTKAFTSSILGMLESEGEISLSESPAEYIPGFTFINNEMNNTINIYDLMSHRTGLPRHDFSWYFFPGETRDALIERIEFMEPFAGVRQQWYYNNFMFLTQGVIAERVSGKSWEENVRERIFQPLGMTRSNLSIDELEASENAAKGYRLKDNKEIEKMDYYRIATMGPAGSINSSASEMAKWLITWINDGKYEGKEIIPSGYQKLAMSSHMVVSAGLPTKEGPDMHFSNYGLGWFLASYKGHYRVEHGGNIDGFSASACFFPSDSLGIVVLVNQNGSAVPGVVRNIISDRMLGTHKTDWIKITKERIDKAMEAQDEAGDSTESTKKEGTSPSHPLEEYAGRYANSGYGELSLTVSGDSLYMDFPIMKMYLGHYHYDIFEPYEVDGTDVSDEVGIDIKINFQTDLNGEVSGLEAKLEPTTDPIFFKKVPVEVAMEKEAMEKLCGEYELAGMIAKFYIKNDLLHLFVPGQPEYELMSLGDNKFKLKIVEGFSVEFIEDEKGNVTECKFIQPNGIFTAKRK